MDYAQSKEAILLWDISKILTLVFLYNALNIVFPALALKWLYPKYNSINLCVYFNKLDIESAADSVIWLLFRFRV